MKKNNLEVDVQNGISTFKSAVKSRIFDIIGIAITICVMAVSLGILELREINWENLLNIIVECIPLFLATVLLDNNYYLKGTFVGKQTNQFVTAVSQYSHLLDELDGHRMDVAPLFCDEYNFAALKQLQTATLRAGAISFEEYDEVRIDENGNKILPLKVLSNNELTSQLGDIRAKVVKKARKIKVRGITVNSLFASISSEDITDIGEDEHELYAKRIKGSIVGYVVSTVAVVVIGVKDFFEWGWLGIPLILFKVLFIFCKSYMSYFKGYNDITISLANHIARKIDIIKQFNSWYDDKYSKNSNKI